MFHYLTAVVVAAVLAAAALDSVHTCASYASRMPWANCCGGAFGAWCAGCAGCASSTDCDDSAIDGSRNQPDSSLPS